MVPTFSLSTRASGLLLHPTSLPSAYGIGDLGPEAFRFVDFLAKSRQTWWQIFPLGPPGYGGSPYQPHSAFAGNPFLISLEILVQQGLLKEKEIKTDLFRNTEKVNFQLVERHKWPLLRLAFDRFLRKGGMKKPAFMKYRKRNDVWLADYAVFCALKEAYGDSSWTKWPIGIRQMESKAIRQAKSHFSGLIQFHEFLQFQFSNQWHALKEFAREKGIGFIGDIPIFVSHDSADVWANPRYFNLDSHGNPLFVAGTPPDFFSASGQRWGNPLYRWHELEKEGYRWWIQRFRNLFTYVDAVRLDHFIGYERYWRIPASDKTAKNGKWIPGPGLRFFKTLLKKFGHVEIIAEDLGAMGDDIRKLRDRFDFPGMKVLQFAFGEDLEAHNYLPHNYHRHCVVYTGTHDNDTMVGWYRDKGGQFDTRSRNKIRKEMEFVKRYLQTNGREIHWDMIRLAHMTVADTVIIPAQDLLGLGSEARMNLPGTLSGNWVWRLKPGALQNRIAERLKSITETYDRASRTNGKTR